MCFLPSAFTYHSPSSGCTDCRAWEGKVRGCWGEQERTKSAQDQRASSAKSDCMNSSIPISVHCSLIVVAGLSMSPFPQDHDRPPQRPSFSRRFIHSAQAFHQHSPLDHTNQALDTAAARQVAKYVQKPHASVQVWHPPMAMPPVLKGKLGHGDRWIQLDRCRFMWRYGGIPSAQPLTDWDYPCPL